MKSSSNNYELLALGAAASVIILGGLWYVYGSSDNSSESRFLVVSVDALMEMSEEKALSAR